jgi:short-subunit dehydrogenase
MRVLITGTTGGIGSAILETFKKNDAEITEINRSDADFSSFEQTGALTDKVSKMSTFDWIVFSHGYVDAEKNFLLQKSEEIEKTFAINILSVIRLTQLLLPHLSPNGGIIFVSSVAALTANGFTAVYSASKAAVNTFAQALAHNRSDLQFYSLCPGPTATAMFEKLQGDMSRAQSPDAVAHVVAEIVSGASDYKSGDIIVIRNGEARIGAHLPD